MKLAIKIGVVVIAGAVGLLAIQLISGQWKGGVTNTGIEITKEEASPAPRVEQPPEVKYSDYEPPAYPD